MGWFSKEPKIGYLTLFYELFSKLDKGGKTEEQVKILRELISLQRRQDEYIRSRPVQVAVIIGQPYIDNWRDLYEYLVDTVCWDELTEAERSLIAPIPDLIPDSMRLTKTVRFVDQKKTAKLKEKANECRRCPLFYKNGRPRV